MDEHTVTPNNVIGINADINHAVPEEHTAQVMPPIEAAPEHKRKPRTPKETCRPLEVITQLNLKALTQPELIAMVKELQEQNAMLNAKVREYSTMAQSAFAQFKTTDENFQKLQMEANAKLRLAEDTVRVCYQNVKMLGGKI